MSTDHPHEGQNLIGIVKSYDDEKRYGFIEGPASSEGKRPDIFVHGSVLRPMPGTTEPCYTLQKGQKVVYDYVVGQKGLKATRVVPSG